MEISKGKVKGWFSRMLANLWVKRKFRELIWFTLFIVGVMSIFVFHYLPENYAIREGQVSPSTIKAPQFITIEDKEKTKERRKSIEENIDIIYILDKKVIPSMEEDIEHTFNLFGTIIRNDELGTEEKVRKLKEEFNLSDESARVLLAIEPAEEKSLSSETIKLLYNNWQIGVREVEVEEKKARILDQVDFMNINGPYRDLIKAVFNKVELHPNYVPDLEAKARAVELILQEEGPVLTTLRKGQKIVGEGEVVTAEHIEILRVLGYQSPVSPYLSLGGVTLFLILSFVLTVLYLKQFGKDLYGKGNSLMLLSLLFLFTLIMAKFITVIKISSNAEFADLVGYLIPVATGSMLIAILLDTKLAIFITILLSFMVGFLTRNQLPYTITAFIGGLVGVYSVTRFSQRLDWVKAGLFVASANVITICSLELINNSHWKIILIGAVLGVINGFISVIFAYGSLPFLESGFKITTSVRLLELSNPNQPLLKRLLIEAPGTYHHSILVGNLGEAAADAVGADSLLVRVGAHYHDIGKLKRPYFFIENQLGGENPHEKLTPPLSTLIITSHVKDGWELARQNGIPKVILDLIEQHHGTSLVTFFYHKALEMGNADTVKESEYRYSGSKPQSKEAVIIMLADNVEAAVRSMSSVTPGKIEGLVRKIIKERLEDGQLDESDLTFKDLDLIANAFMHILHGIFHSRIEYPEKVLEAMKGGMLPHANSNEQSAGKNSNDSEGRGSNS